MTPIPPFTTKELIRFAREYVMFAPKSKCKQYQSFRVIYEYINLKQDKATIDEGHFFSKNGLDISMPSLQLLIQGNGVDRPKNKSNNCLTCIYACDFFSIDKYKNDSCKNCGCDERSKHEILCDNKEMMLLAIMYIESVIYATVNYLDGTVLTGYFAKIYLDKLVGLGTITSYTKISKTKVVEIIPSSPTNKADTKDFRIEVRDLWAIGLEFGFTYQVNPACELDITIRDYKPSELCC